MERYLHRHDGIYYGKIGAIFLCIWLAMIFRIIVLGNHSHLAPRLIWPSPLCNSALSAPRRRCAPIAPHADEAARLRRPAAMRRQPARQRASLVRRPRGRTALFRKALCCTGLLCRTRLPPLQLRSIGTRRTIPRTARGPSPSLPQMPSAPARSSRGTRRSTKRPP